MKLAVISNTRGCSWAGSETIWHLAALQALKLGHKVTAFLHADLCKSDKISEFIWAGGQVRQWKPFPIARFQPWKDQIRPDFSSSLLNAFDSLLVSLGSLPSLCYVPGLVNGLMKTSRRIVLMCQFNASHLPISVRERERVREVIRRSAACLFVSQRNLEEAVRQFAIDPPGAAVIGNPIRTVVEQPLSWPLGETVNLASVARFETAWKGQDILLDLLRQARWRQRQWHLTFYGSGPDELYLRRLTDFFHLENRVSFAGFVSELDEIWAKNHLLIMPSHGEGLPLAALEAMMFGRPAVLTDVGGNAELIQDGKTGFLADAPTVRSFGNALERAFAAREDWPEIGCAAHKKAKMIVQNDATTRLMKIWMANPN